MANIFDVAKYILERQGEMSTMKLQKLCYYSQAWHYTWTEHLLFPEKFKAWVNGPVCPVLFYAHQGKYLISANEVTGNASHLTPDEADSVDHVLESYGKMTPSELREQTHIEDPWRIARKGLPDGVPCKHEITTDSMGLYYGSL